MIEEMINRINAEIKLLYKFYEVNGVRDDIGLARISGQIDMLNIVTGKEHYFDSEGVHEREEA